MRMNSYLIFGIMLSSSLLAQQATNPSTPPPIETPAAAPGVTNTAAATPAETVSTNAPTTKKKSVGKKKSQKKSVAKKKEAGAELKTVPLVPGPAVVEANHVNVRGQARLNSEVVAHLSKDQKVTVLEEITRNNSGPDEPSAWAKIALPSDTHVWANSSFIDITNKTVKPKKLNVRSGPGENFSVLGRMQRGDGVTQVGEKGDWLEIEAPTNAYAFVAAQYLKQEPAAPAVSPTEPAPASATVTNEQPIAAAPTEAPAATAAAEPATNTTAISEPLTNTASSTPPAAEEPPPKRIVEREGIVRGTVSIQAPTHFELVSPDNGRAIDYLYTTSTELDLRRYKGLRIVVTGEEGLEERWGNTPVITIQKIQVVE
jgi:uncharacterized protein YgiM (DUF1202 family)